MTQFTCDFRGLDTKIGSVYSSASRVENSGTDDFVQFDTANYEPVYLTPRIIHPRPLAESDPWERSRLTLPGVQWEIPVGVVGLSKPIGFTVDGPAGMEFIESFPALNEETGEYVEADKNGYIRWVNPTPGTHEYTITCRGQDGNTLTVASELTVSETGIVVVSPTGNDTNPGTLALPKQTLNPIFASGFGNYQVWLRGGTDYTPSSSLNISGAGNPKALIGYPGESVGIDMTDSVLVMDNGNGVCINNINFKNSNASSAQSRVIYGTTNWINGHRFLCYDVTFDGFEPGTVGDDNPGPITVLAPGAYRDDFYVTGVSLTNITNTSNTAALGSLYQLRNGLIDRVTIGENVSASRGVFLKSACRNFAIHRVTSLENLFANGAVSINLAAVDPGVDNDLIEVAWCKLDADDVNGYVIRHQGANTDPGTPNVYIYRNNLSGRIGYGGSTTVNSTVRINRNVITSSSATPIQSSTGDITVISTDNLIGNMASGYLDANMHLAGDALTYLGQRGASYG